MVAKIDLSRFRDSFFEEALEHTATLERGLLSLESDSTDQDLLNTVFRAAHSIKGAAGYFGMSELTAFTHALESVLQAMRSGQETVSCELIELLLQSTDMLGDLVVASRDETAPPPGVPQLLSALEHMLGAASDAPVAADSNPAAGPADRALWHVVIRPELTLLKLGMDPLLLLRELGELGQIIDVSVDLTDLPSLADLDPEDCYLSWTLRLATESGEPAIREVFAFVTGLCCLDLELLEEAPPAAPDVAATPAPEPGPLPNRAAGGSFRAAESSSLRVPIERVDELINLVGELVIAQSMVEQIAGDLAGDRTGALSSAVTHLAGSTRELQERIMQVRMLPVGTLFERFPRAIRDISVAHGKRVTLVLEGEDTELDKAVLEAISDPLMHLVRNAVDHGIESPEERRAAGKPEEGRITISASHESGCVVIEVQDDGRGLDRDRILAKAVAMGLMDAGETLSDERIDALILHPGLSTTTEVSELSGRGVGMDVVASNVEAVNGSIAISSSPGEGTRFAVRLPLTLAILDTLSVAVGEHTYLLPLLSVVESVHPAPGDLRVLPGGGELLEVRGEQVPVLRLSRLLGIDSAQLDAGQGLVVIVDHEERRMGLFVDSLLDQRQAVIKNMETNYRPVEGLMGATILGDGSVAFILDVSGLARLASRHQRPLKCSQGGEIDFPSAAEI